MTRRRRAARALGLAVASLAAMSSVLARGRQDIDPNYLALTDCPQEPGCPALVLEDETELSNEKLQAHLSRRRLLKLFTIDGVLKYGDVDVIETVGYEAVKNLSGRTVLPDGSSIPLKQDNIFVKTVVKHGRRRLRVKSAKFPGVVPGAIIDVSYDLVDPRPSYYGEWTWWVQDHLPILRAKLTVKPGAHQLASRRGGVEQLPLEEKALSDRVRQFTMTNVPSIPDEPLSPPEDVVRARVCLYSPLSSLLWTGRLAAAVASRSGRFMDKADGIPAKVKEVVKPDDLPIRKVAKLYRFVQEMIGTEEERADESEESSAKDAENVGEVLARGFGDQFERTMLFLALVKEAGLEPAVLLIAGRDNALLDTEVPDESQFNTFAAAVKTGEDWTFYDPAVRHCPFSMISPEKEGGAPNALIITPLKPAVTGRGSRPAAPSPGGTLAPKRIVRIPFSAAAKNVLVRTATARLAADGSAVVEVTDQGIGLVDLDHRIAYEEMDPGKREAALGENLRATISAAQLLTAQFEEIESFEKTATLKYRFTSPGAATAAGDRLVLTPSLFNAGRPSPFSAEKRRTPVHFPHAQKSVERITFEIPAGYAIGDLPRAEIIREGPFVIVTNYAQEDGKLVFSRRLEIDAAEWPLSEYTRLRSFFEKVQEIDRQVVILRKEMGS